MKPLVTVYSEVSADGKTTHRRGASSKPMMAFEDRHIRRYRHGLRASADAIMVGSNTIRLDDPHLTVRDAPGSSPLRVVPASTANLPLSSNIFSDGYPTLVAVSAAAPPARVAAMANAGASIVTCGVSRVDLKTLLEHLHDGGIKSLIVEGGATLLAALFREDLVDRLIVQHLPVVFGGRDVPAMVDGEAIDRVEDAVRLRLVEVRAVGQHAVVIYDRA